MPKTAIPFIGIPCVTVPRRGDGRLIYGNNPPYAQAIIEAGGAPIFIPPLDVSRAEEALETIYEKLDGLVLSGGPDVDPRAYGEEPIPACGKADRPRDAIEIALVRRAVADELPILAICRGMQVFNVAFGGTLYQDIPTQLPQAERHQHPGETRDQLIHGIDVLPDSLLATALGTTHTRVNSLHHQSVARLATNLRSVATAPDGVIEGLELPGHPFAVAVQYHPEELAATDAISRNLFAAFVSACAVRLRHGEEAVIPR